ncbi:cadherin repeat domain-containing protein, partial [Limnohabitans sp. Rim8]|uniref:beta strand repeat-containing protein n=1 Tax=Limnohabitans sp. Rim8 TaxID=1100718 RepID=UPI002626C20C
MKLASKDSFGGVTKKTLQIQALPNERIELFIDGVKHTGAELVGGKRIQLKKQDKNLVFELDGEPFAQVDNFYDTEGVSLDGLGWDFSQAQFVKLDDTGLVALPDDSAPLEVAAVPLIAASGAGGAGAFFGGLGISAAYVDGGGQSQTIADNFVRGTITTGDVVTGNDLQVAVYAIAEDGTATLIKTGAVDGLGAYNINIGSYTGAVRVVVESKGSNPDILDEATNLKTNLSIELQALGVVAGTDTQINITPLTHLAGLKNTTPTAGSIVTINAAVGLAFGLVDITTTPVITISNPVFARTDESSNAKKYGNVLAALSGMDVQSGSMGASIDLLVQNLSVSNASNASNSPTTATLNEVAKTNIVAGARAADPQTPTDLPSEIIKLIGAQQQSVALSKIEAYNNGNVTIPAALTPVDYANAGITGVTAENVAAVNAQVLAQAAGGADTAPEVQLLVAAANTALAKIEAYNNSNNTIPAPLTVADYVAAGITGVTADNLAAVNAQVLAQAAGGADTAPEVQALVTTANTAIQKIEAYSNGNGVSPAALSLADYTNAGITGVTADNLAALNAQVLAQATGGADTAPEVQAVVDTAVTNFGNALTVIQAYALANSGTAPSAQIYLNAGVTGVTSGAGGNLDSINSALASLPVVGTSVNTPAKIQFLVNAYTAILTSADGFDNNATAPSKEQYAAVGVINIQSTAEVGLLGDALDITARTAVSTTAGLQVLADAVHAVMQTAALDTTAGATTLVTKAQLQLLGVTGVTDANLGRVINALVGTANDGSAVNTLATLQAVVNVTNSNEAPTAISLSATTIAENVTVGTGVEIGTLTVTDPDASGNNNVLSLSGTDAASFAIVGGKLMFTGTSPDFETKPSYSVTVTSTDG